MRSTAEEVEYQKQADTCNFPAKSDRPDSPVSPLSAGNPHLAFQKNYPKNIFIPLIEYLNEVGLQEKYELCVGTRASFEGKNVVSLAEIYTLVSQQWFLQKINTDALITSMSNKILMNSKIKKKLFHLLLVKGLFTIPVEDGRQFKKMISKMANQLARLPLPDDPLFHFPSALIYLLSLFAEGLLREDKANDHTCHDQSGQSEMEGETVKGEVRELSSKQQYKMYISKIISALNHFRGDSEEFLQLIEGIKNRIFECEQLLRQKYGLSAKVPEWGSFNEMVIDRCYLARRQHQKLTFSLLNEWIQKFKERASRPEEVKIVVQQIAVFKPIILVSPPQ